MDVLRLTSKIPPSVNHYLSYRAIIRGGKAVAISYPTKEAVQYKKEFAAYVQEQAKAQGWTREPNKTQHFYVDTVFFFSQIDMDANNYFKVMCDAITDAGCVWMDDNVACERVQGIYYDSANPRIEVEIKPVGYIGVFDDASQLDVFRANCLECVRHKRNCSLLNRAVAGYIQPEIENGVCKARRVKKMNDKKKKGAEEDGA